MRLLHAMAGAKWGGAEGFVERLVIALQRRGVEQRFLLRPEPERQARLAQFGVDMVELPFGGKFDTRTGTGFRQQIADYRPDLVISYMSRAASYCPSRRKMGDGAPRVARLGGYYDLKYYETMDHLVGNTPDLVAYFKEEGWPADRAHYLPNFVDTTLTVPLPWADYGVPEDVPLIVALGRLHPNKAFDTLLAAMVRLPGVWLWIAGDGPERESLEAEAARLGVADRVRFLGWIDDAGAVIESADVVCVPSRHEPLGNVVLEAWARGRPVVAAASEGPSQLIEHDRTGVLAAIDDPDSLATALIYVLENADAADRLAEAGMARYEEDFGEEAVVGRYLELFGRLIAAGVDDGAVAPPRRRASGALGR